MGHRIHGPALRPVNPALPGCGAIELAVRFVLWMQQHKATPSGPQISQHFGVHRATGYRWRQQWLAATGQPDDNPNQDTR